jgi:hypothetical protein
VLRVTTKTGRTIRLTPEHPFLTEEAGWQPLSALAVGRRIAVSFGAWIASIGTRTEAIVQIEPAGEAEVFDAEVPGLANFLAAGIWVHNSGVVEEAVDYLVGMRRLDRAMSLTPADRERYRDVLFLTLLKNRHGVLGHEFALRMDPASLLFLEDTTTDAPAEDAASRAAAGWRR